MFTSTLQTTLGIALALFAALGIGLGAGYLWFHSDAAAATARIDAANERIDRLEASLAAGDSRYNELLDLVAGYKVDIAEAEAANEGLQQENEEQASSLAAARAEAREAGADLTSAQRQISTLQTGADDADELRGQIGALQDAVAPFEHDRLLLVELRKDPPSTERQAREYWERVKELAVATDPGLAQSIDRIILELPTYFAWFDGEYEDSCESVDAFFDSGASAYGSRSSDLQNEVMLLLINRLDAAAALVAD